MLNVSRNEGVLNLIEGFAEGKLHEAASFKPKEKTTWHGATSHKRNGKSRICHPESSKLRANTGLQGNEAKSKEKATRHQGNKATRKTQRQREGNKAKRKAKPEAQNSEPETLNFPNPKT